MILELNGKKVDVVDTEFFDNSVSITGAYWLGTDIDLTDEEMAELELDYQEELLESKYGEATDQAEYYYDIER